MTDTPVLETHLRSLKFLHRGKVRDIYRNPQHPYTQALLSAIPGGDFTRKRDALIA